jgi:glycosyltransferase involved in cell wall biosynthesis
MPKNIGFVSTRFAGTDGVSLESAKWAEVLWQDGHISYWFSGKSDRDPGISACIPEAYFGHPENEWINRQIWGKTTRSRLLSNRIRALAEYLKSSLYRFVDAFNIEVLILENALTIPMHLPLALAITELLAESGIPAIAHHHDFYWERTRFLINGVQDYLETAFPPKLPNLTHAVINRAAQEQLSLRKGVASLLIPNVFNFEQAAPGADDYAGDVRQAFNLHPDDLFILQPTRIVPRKGIEHAIKLLGMLNDPRCKLIISHDAGDEGMEYKWMLQDLARDEGVDLRFISERIGESRQLDSMGRKIYTLEDLYPHADLVTYPSSYEGFGNALLEAIYYRLPVLINRYSIFVQDIEPRGFRLAVMDGFVNREAVHQVRRILDDRDYRKEMVDHNYRVARQYYSYGTLRRSLRTLFTQMMVWHS